MQVSSTRGAGFRYAPELLSLEPRVLLSGNAIRNGDFELRNVGFLSDYVYEHHDLISEGSYDIVTDPKFSNIYATS